MPTIINGKLSNCPIFNPIVFIKLVSKPTCGNLINSIKNLAKKVKKNIHPIVKPRGKLPLYFCTNKKENKN